MTEMFSNDLLSRYWADFFMPFTYVMVTVGIAYLLTVATLKNKKPVKEKKERTDPPVSIDSQVLDVYSRTV